MTGPRPPRPAATDPPARHPPGPLDIVRADADAVVAVAAVVAGLLLGSQRRPGLGARNPIAIVAFAICTIGALALARRDRAGGPKLRSRLPVGAVALAMLGVVSMARSARGADAAGRALTATGGTAVEATVTFLSDPAPAFYRVRAMARVRQWHVIRDASGAVRGSRAHVVLMASAPAAGHLAFLDAGDTVHVVGRFRPLAGFDRQARWQHAVARFDVRDVLAVRGPSGPLARTATAARAVVLSGTRALAPSTAALLAGFLLGDTRGVDAATRAAFRRSGLSHLLAVSGANVAFVLALAGPVLRRASLAGRFLLGAGVLTVFGAMTRWQPSVLRAVAMALVAMAASWAGRPVSSLRVLCIAAVGLLLADPFLVHSAGFGLSCGACAGIAVLAGPIATRLHGPRWACEALAVTLAAQVGVAPVLLPVFGSLPLVALPANLLAVPAVGPLTIVGLAGSALSRAVTPVAPHIAPTLLLPASGLTGYLTAVATLSARFPLAIGTRAACAGAVIATTAAAARCVARRRYPHPRCNSGSAHTTST